jgi:hypothetical protein
MADIGKHGGLTLMTAPSTFKQADMKRALAAVKAAGLPISQVLIDQFGRFVIHTEQSQPTGKGTEWDDHVKTIFSRTS